MFRIAPLSLLALLALALSNAGAAEQFELDGHSFTLPDGFSIERVAGPPLVDRPIVAAFDEQGRLYVADSSGSNDPVQKQLEEKPHRIVRLEDTNGDGVFDTSIVFADRMMFPEGTMWLDGSLYVSAPPSIWKLTDTNGDGVADVREEWFDAKTLTGCANDLHGPYLGPDGMIYWCKGAFAEQTYERPDDPPFVTRAAHIFRWRPDRTGPIEAVMTGGMDNPVDVVFTPGGERIFTTTFLQHPGGGRRDGLIHAIYGGVYGKVHHVIDDHKRTSPDVMPTLVHLGPSAPCGLERYQSEVFGPEYRNNLFACLFNLHKVTRHVLTPQGATFDATDEDFLVSDNRDFHPTDVLEDADGSLLVIDTGGWYKLCCPTSQLDKPDVLGAIYRIRRRGAPEVADPRGLELDWDGMDPPALTRLLDDSRPAIRERAMQALAKRGAEAIGPLVQSNLSRPSVERRRNAVWTATRIDHPDARNLARFALNDPDDTVRQAALHSISLWRDENALPELLELLTSESSHNRRAAAEALGRIGDPSAVPALLDAIARAEVDDPILDHSLTYALIEIADPQATAEGLSSVNDQARRAALIALDQMDGAELKPELAASLLDADDPGLKATASWVLGRHPEWADALTGVFLDRLLDSNLKDAERLELEQHLARFASAAPIQEMLAETLADADAPASARRSALRAIGRSGIKDVPEPWILALTTSLNADESELAPPALAAIRSLSIPEAAPKADALRNALLAIGRDPDHLVELRLTALAGVPGGLAEIEPELFAFLLDQLSADQPVSNRSAAVEVLQSAQLDQDQWLALANALRDAGPLEVDRLLATFERTEADQVGLAIVSALEDSKARTSLQIESLEPILSRFGPEVQIRAEALYAALSAATAEQAAHLKDLIASLPTGDIRRGQDVFNSEKAACSSCHAIGYLGGKVGPDLTRIGQIRDGRDLLESIVYPSASFVRSYEPMLVATLDGRVINGVLTREDSQVLVLSTGPDEEARIPRDQVEEMQPSTVSIMPAGLDQQLTPQELADLVEFLKACK